jgi:glycosyltransferase involved in cell wall biosynthesis
MKTSETLNQAAQNRPIGSDSTRHLNVAICICTYRRALQLDSLLGALANQSWRRLPQPAIIVFVVENETAGAGKEIYEKHLAQGKLSIRYIVEPRLGIPMARNRFLDIATSHFDFIAFIDDDELPAPDWLEQLLLLQIATNADAVTGPCVASYVASPPAWMVRGHFHGCSAPTPLQDWEVSMPVRVLRGLTRRCAPPETLASGSRVKRFSTSNVIIRSEILRATGLHFDESLGSSGGSDTLFSRRIALAGYRMIWSNEAIVYDMIPPARMSAHWLIRRALQHGYQATLIDSRLEIGFMPKMQRSVFALGRVLFNLLLIPRAVFRGTHHVIWHLLQVARGLGQIIGQFGIPLHYYPQTISLLSANNKELAESYNAMEFTICRME